MYILHILHIVGQLCCVLFCIFCIFSANVAHFLSYFAYSFAYFATAFSMRCLTAISLRLRSQFRVSSDISLFASILYACFLLEKGRYQKTVDESTPSRLYLGNNIKMHNMQNIHNMQLMVIERTFRFCRRGVHLRLHWIWRSIWEIFSVDLGQYPDGYQNPHTG